ncbi:hypothetical protein TWF694_003670 [Orbilia ellipsospora]|uniref:Extracellular membrane protein CFEM domain-containing protein n=1 Tax=Orbilia ellipsospora TaxID=2528407 RepID=A0AAV9WYX5_9PEZI
MSTKPAGALVTIVIVTPVYDAISGGQQCGPSSNYCDRSFPKQCGNWLGLKNTCCYGTVAFTNATASYLTSCDAFPQLSDNTYDSIAKLPSDFGKCVNLIVTIVNGDGTDIQPLTPVCVDLIFDESKKGSSSSSKTSTEPTSHATGEAQTPPHTATPTAGPSTSAGANGTAILTSSGSSLPEPTTQSSNPTATTTSAPNSASRKNGSSVLASFVFGSMIMAMFLGAQL